MHVGFAWGAPEYCLTRQQWVEGSLDEVFAFFQNPHNLARITPDWLGFGIRRMSTQSIEAGAIISYRLRWLRIPYTWRTLVVEWTPPERFIDSALRSPFISWRHTHSFEAAGGGVLMHDCVRYRVPFGPIGMAVHALIVRRQLGAIFDYRQRVVAELMCGGRVLTEAPAT